MKMMKLAVLPVAIAGVLASNAAFAGSEACFEVYTGAHALEVDNWDTPYQNASCVAADLATPKPARIAYELTQNLTLDLDAVDGTSSDMQIVYIPTTDIPGGTVIGMTLTGAKFFGNEGQIHLMKSGNETVASTDGRVEGEPYIEFMTKAGTTIGAGTRLVLTKSSTAVVPIGVKIANTQCASDSSAAKVTIAATLAKTDGKTGYDIKGGVSSPAELVDMSTQFITFNGVTPTKGEVNAESTNGKGQGIFARTEFVYNVDEHTLEQQQYQLVTPVSFINRGPMLDRKIDLDSDDHLVQKFWATNNTPTANVKVGLYNGYDGDENVQIPVAVENGVRSGVIAKDSASATAYSTEAVNVFEPVVAANTEEVPPAYVTPYGTAEYNQLFYVLENVPMLEDSNAQAIMNFNYKAYVNAALNFGDENYLDHCTKDQQTHEVGVNGAVLKVPYAFDNNNTWIRITNESTEAADITMDIFDESGNEKNGVVVGSVGKKASVVLVASDLVAKAKAAGLTTDGKSRFTMTFTVTAPMNTVHGVSVQKIPGGVDRVVPVLDQNEWKM